MQNKKSIVKLGSVKGNMLGTLNKYLQSLGLSEIDKKDRKLVHYFELQECILEVTLLRWEDIKRYNNRFDLILFGSDQWLESGHKSMVTLKYFDQKNCRLSLLVKKGLEVMPLSYFLDKPITTGFPELAKSYLGIIDKNIVKMSGSVEASVTLGWSEAIFDIVESGKTAEENGLVEYKKCFDIGAVLATSKIEKMPFFEDCGLIQKMKQGKTIAFDGNEGSGKSTLAKHLSQHGFNDNEASVLVAPYSGYVGYEAMAFLKNGKPVEWATNIGINHWRPTANINKVYDRNIMTALTELININLEKEEILEILKTWDPLPDIIFYCYVKKEKMLKRCSERQVHDEFDAIDSLIKYQDLYEKAYHFIKENMDIKIVKVNTENNPEETLQLINKELKNV